MAWVRLLDNGKYSHFPNLCSVSRSRQWCSKQPNNSYYAPPRFLQGPRFLEAASSSILSKVTRSSTSQGRHPANLSFIWGTEMVVIDGVLLSELTADGFVPSEIQITAVHEAED
tara:strand:- start:84 stop:425 length:342 start_codon:yes stop_codon:yes gene_type:complete